MNDTRRRGAAGVKQIVIIGILVIAGVTLLMMYNRHEQKKRLEAERQAEAARIERERAEEAARAQLKKEQEEAERKIREEQEAREKAQRAREEAERERARKAAEAEAERQKKIEIENRRREAYSTAQGRFKTTLDLEENAPPSEKIQSAKAGCKFWFIFDSHPTDKLIYEVDKVSYSRMEVRALSADADAKNVPYLDFIRMVNNSTYAYSSGDKVWLKCKKPIAGSYSVPRRGRNFCVAASVLGAMYGTLVKLGTNLGYVRCRVTLLSSSGKTNIPLGEIGFGEVLPRRSIEENIGKLIGRKASSAIPGTDKVAKPTFKRTVVLYNGDVIKKEITVTKVPRTFTFRPPPEETEKYRPAVNRKKSKKMEEWESKKEFARKKWKELYDEAVRQEKREKRDRAAYRQALALKKKEINRMEEDAVRLSKDDEIIDSTLENYKIIVEVVEQK